jgi:hypothetical protein
MPRPKPADPTNVDFHVRTTRGEADAIDALVARWAADARAQGYAVPVDKTAWFRGMVRREAIAKGIAVGEPEAAEPQKAPPKGKGKRAAEGA